jgi:hypothetical protein
VGQRHARIGLLLATTSVAALLAAAQTPASAACTISVTTPSGPVTNAAAIDCIEIIGTTVTGNVTNSKYPPAEPGALGCEPLEAAVGVADAAPGSGAT